MGADKQQALGSFSGMHDAGFGPMKNRAGVDARKDRGIIDAQHFYVTRAA